MALSLEQGSRLGEKRVSCFAKLGPVWAARAVGPSRGGRAHLLLFHIQRLQTQHGCEHRSKWKTSVISTHVKPLWERQFLSKWKTWLDLWPVENFNDCWTPTEQNSNVSFTALHYLGASHHIIPQCSVSLNCCLLKGQRFSHEVPPAWNDPLLARTL